MNIKYRVIEVHEKEHSFVVRYYTDLLTEDMLAIQKDGDGNVLRCRSDYSLTIFDPEATVEEIEKQIQMSAPAAWFKMLETALTAQGNTPGIVSVKSKLNIEHEFEHVPAPVYQPKDELTDAEIEAILTRLATPKDE